MDNLEGGIAALRTWSRVARGMIAVFLLVQLVLIAGNGLLLFAELSSSGGGKIMVWEPATGVRTVSAYNQLFAVLLGGAVVLLGAFFLLAVVPITVWIYRAHANLREAGLAGLAHSPGWTVASYFLPLANLVIPFRAMRELHNRSHGEDQWQARASVADVSSWWSCHLAAMVVLAVASFVAALATIPNLYVVQPPGVNTGLFLFALVLLAGSAIFLFRTIGAVTSAQQNRMHLDTAQVFG
jgi:hypothetical protein